MNEANGKKAWTDSEIKEAYGVAERTTSLLAKRFVENGLESALERQKQANRHHKVTGEVETQICVFILIFNHIVDKVENMIKDYSRNTNLWSTIFCL